MILILKVFAFVVLIALLFAGIVAYMSKPHVAKSSATTGGKGDE